MLASLCTPASSSAPTRWVPRAAPCDRCRCRASPSRAGWAVRTTRGLPFHTTGRLGTWLHQVASDVGLGDPARPQRERSRNKRDHLAQVGHPNGGGPGLSMQPACRGRFQEPRRSSMRRDSGGIHIGKIRIPSVLGGRVYRRRSPWPRIRAITATIPSRIATPRMSSLGICIGVKTGKRPARRYPPSGRAFALPLLEERVLDEPRMVFAALGAIDEDLLLGAQASNLRELVPGVNRQACVRTEDHQPLGQSPAVCFLS
jgi:hypothetical protein